MNNDLINLLPTERLRMLSRDYIFRVGVTVAILVTIVTLVMAILLIPTFVLLEWGAKAKSSHLASIESSISSVDEAKLSSRLSALSENVAALVALSKTQTVSSVVRDVLTISRPGIVISGFVYAPATTPNKGQTKTLAISGSASTRDALRDYQLALQNAPAILSATLPVSAYAKDSDIPFTITLTLSP